MGTASENRAIVTAFWDDMYGADWPAFVAHFTDDATYTDAATAADEFATGPDQILARLRLAFDPLESISDERGLIVAEGDAVVTEHVELWRWTTGEEMRLPFVTIHQLRDGLIYRWIDYWDMQTLMDAAPQAWWEHVMVGYQ